VRCNTIEPLEHLRLMYGRFRLDQCHDGGEGRSVPHRLRIIDNLRSSDELLIENDRYVCRFTQHGHEGHFSCTDREAIEPDMTGFCTSRTLLQSSILSTVARMTEEFFLFHAGAVSHANDGIILPAAPGMGKTTLVLKLVARGCRFLSDEVACINAERRIVAPFPRKLLVRSDSEAVLGMALPQNATPLAREGDEQESAFDIEDMIPDCLSGPCTPRYVMFLRGFGDEPRLERMANSNALFELFGCGISPLLDMSRLLFGFAGLLNDMECYHLVAGDPEKTADVVMDLLERRQDSSSGL
jgi:hypothetical protein